MISIYFKFTTLPNLFLFLFVSGVCALWAWSVLKKGNRLSLLPFILLQLALFVVWWRITGIDMDETEHLHCAWMVSGGIIPYRDFWQAHPPLLWVLLAPLFKILRPTAEIFEMSRMFAASLFGITALLGLRIARKLMGKRANASLYIFILLSASLMGEYLRLRPDTFMNLFLLAGVYFSVNIPTGRKRPAFFSGVAFALAFSFISKQYFLYLLPVIAIFISKDKERLAELFSYTAGFVVGSIPLLWYLLQNNIFSDYLYWVFVSNRERIYWSVFFPLGIGGVGVWGAYLLFRQYLVNQDKRLLIACLAFSLSTLSSFSGCAATAGNYYLGFWFILCAIMASGLDINKALNRLSTGPKRIIAAGVFFGILLMPNAIEVKVHDKSFFAKDKQAISQLLRFSLGESCLVFLPHHPVFVSDATRLYSDWQYEFVDNFNDVKQDAKKSHIAEQILNRRPAIVEFKKERVWLPLSLYIKGLISEEELRRLKEFFETNYTTRYIGEIVYYVRKDLADL